MKRLSVAIILILFQISCIRTMKSGNEGTSADAPTAKGEQTKQTNPSGSDVPTTAQENPNTPIMPTDEELLKSVPLITGRGTRSFSRTQSTNASDPEHHKSMSDEDRKDTEDLHKGHTYSRKLSRKKEKVESNPRLVKYWPNKLPHTGSMTPYRFLRDSIPDLEYFKDPKKRSLYKDLTPVRIWTLFRHDIRYPGKETTHAMRTRLRNIKEAIFLKLYENKELLNDNSVINMDIFLKLLDEWDVVDKLSEGVVYVSNETLNVRKSKKEKKLEWQKLSPQEQSTRLKKRKGADEQIKEPKGLTPLGELEMEATGQRFKEKFNDLLLNTEPESRLFKFTDCHRTRVSAKKFYSVIYGEPEDGDESWHAPIDTGDEGKDPLLKYDALCEHWKKNYKKSNLNAHQLKTFVTGKEIQKALKGITNILKFVINSITFSDGKLLYESCAFEIAWERENPWCMFLTKKYQAVFEYMEDFEFYKNDGPDNDMNKKVGCFLFRDMIKRLIGDVVKDDTGNITWNLHLEEGKNDEGTITIKTEETDLTGEEPDTPKEKSEGVESIEQTTEETSAKEKSDEIQFEKMIKKVTFYFTHLTGVLKFITHLGVHVDKEHLTIDNYNQMKNRKWRSARIGAFGTNISILLMKWGNLYYILVLHQERPLILPGCDDELCRLDKFLMVYHESIFNCNYEEICKKYKHPLFSPSMRPFQDSIPHTELSDLSSLASTPSSPFSSHSSFSSLKSLSFDNKEI